MKYRSRLMKKRKNIAIVAHDNRKNILLDWAKKNKNEIIQHNIYATGTTGKLLEELLNIDVTRFNSGPLGGDQQVGAKIAEGEIDFLIFFWDPLQPMPHDPDVKALLRLSVLWNIPTACNRATADFMVTSNMFKDEYERLVPDYSKYLNRLDS